MNEISNPSPFDALRQTDAEGEFWSARDLMTPLGYARWESFADAISRASISAHNAGTGPGHFRGVPKVIEGGRWGTTSVQDFRLTRYGAYLVAMNGDPRKPEIAAAQTYFATKTREAEVRTELDELEVARRYVLALEAKRALETKVAALEPAAQAWDTLASADGDYSVREAAYVLNRDPAIQIGQNRLFNLLREWRLIDGRDIPYAAHERHVRLRARSYNHPQSGEEMPAKPQVRITAEGLRYLHRRMGGTEPLAA